jgi:hypothetical protein
MHTFFNPNAPFPTWQQFLKRSDNIGLNVMQAKQKYLTEQTNYYRMMQPGPMNMTAVAGAGTNASAGPTFTNTFSLNFDGINDSAINNDATFNITDAFSISAWIKTDTNGQNSDVIFFAGDGSNSRYGLDMAGSGGKARFVLKTSAGISRISFTESIIDNEWHHLLGTWDGTIMRLYLDGDLNTSGTNNGTLGSQDSIMIGSWVSGTQLLYQGFVDEAAIFTSTLSAEEVAIVYNNGIAGDISSLNPVAWYRLEEGSGTTVINSGTGGNNLTRTGATYSTDIPG